ncbi:hypothetical protein PybrP1_009700 [[Pythium] brassicae (nom. inval.)]|nr:hypothetical protein PybrP1_009700 [[Pythium] brassicae (nom. inval.)]
MTARAPDGTLASFDTVETADCVEACPVDGFENSLVVATYQLHKGDDGDRRSGTLQHFLLEHENETEPDEEGEDESEGGGTDDCRGNVRITRQAQIETRGGVFDAKWSAHAAGGKALLAAATSSGTLELYALADDADGQHVLGHTGITTEADESAMCLSLDWSNRVIPSEEPAVCVSHSDGTISVWSIAQSGVVPTAKWQAHDLFGSPIEAWIVAFSCHNPNVLFSGADDATVKGWDLRVDPAGSSSSTARSPLFTNARAHSMGVCSLQFHPHDERLVVVGSYDEHVSVWDHRNMKVPLALHATGGGVWRLKWHPQASRQDYLLAACMHNGFQVLKLDAARGALARTVHYERHESLAYGVDWWRDAKSLAAAAPVVGSCSFYDHVFHVWRQSLERRLD